MENKVEKFNKDNKIKETFSYGIIYIYSIPLESHRGRFKIGMTTTNIANPTQKDVEVAAKNNRIEGQTKTADIPYDLEYATLAITNNGDYFSDQDVHNVLIRSGFPRKSVHTKNSHSEWFEINLGIAKNAIQAVKEGRKALSTREKTVAQKIPFPFRPNQIDAINKTNEAIKKNRKHFLWNAKMRFGKTSAAMQVAKENKMKKVLIVTHRPSVSVDWYADFNQIFAGTNFQYASKTRGENISTLIKGDKPFVYFASLQDLRLSKRVIEDESAGSHAKGFDKNDEVFDTAWDILIVDEAHEGTQSDLGGATFSKILTNFTLQLSGTPFNILHKHEEEDVYTWDYVMEQEAKLNWEEANPGMPNPYAEMPTLSIFTYDIDTFASHIGNLGKNFHDSLDGAFKFHEFFRVRKDDEGNDIAEFVYEPMVKKFLDLLVDDTLYTKFPYATEEYRNYSTQKPEDLLKRIINASSDMGMVVADFFIGSGTTALVANDLDRKFVASDIGINAIQTSRDDLVKRGAGFDVIKIKDGVRLFRNPAQTTQKIFSLIDGFKPRAELGLGEFWDGGIVAEKGSFEPVKFIGVDKKLTKELLDAVLEEIYALEEAESGASKVNIIYAFKDLEIDQNYVNKEIKDAGKTTLAVELISLDDLLAEKRDMLFSEDSADIDVKKEGGKCKVKIKKFFSPYLKAKINEYNARKVKKGTLEENKQKAVKISDEGLELIEAVQFDTDLKKSGIWTSDLDLEDKAGVKDKIKGVYELPSDKFKMKIRNIAGDEIILDFNK